MELIPGPLATQASDAIRGTHDELRAALPERLAQVPPPVRDDRTRFLEDRRTQIGIDGGFSGVT